MRDHEHLHLMRLVATAAFVFPARLDVVQEVVPHLGDGEGVERWREALGVPVVLLARRGLQRRPGFTLHDVGE